MSDPRADTSSLPVSNLPPTLGIDLLEQALRVVPTLNLRDIGAQLLAPLVHASGATRGSLMIVNPDTGRLMIAAGVGIRPELIGRDTEWRPNSISEWVFRKRQGLVLNGRVKTAALEGLDDSDLDTSLCVPVEDEHQVIGVLNLSRSGSTPFQETEMHEIIGVLPPVAAAIERACDANRALRFAAQMRGNSGLMGRTLLPLGATEALQYQFAFGRSASLAEGGDLVERVSHAGGAHSLMATDVEGDGLDAAITSSFVQGVFAVSAAADRSAAAIVGRVNAELHQRCAGRANAALWVAQLAPSGLVVSCNAGYPPPLWIPADDSTLVRLGTGGPKAGQSAQPQYQEEQIRMMAGDILVVVSDGVLCTRNVMSLPFGEDRVTEIANEMRRHPLDSIVTAILEGVEAYSGRRAPTDDHSVLVVRYAPEH
ncbi:MAG: GAF domain-containing SpoIIE family protein phosphatase [Candidatus Eisenbacteria bacterium]